MPKFNAEQRIRDKLKERLAVVSASGLALLRQVVGVQAILAEGDPPRAKYRAIPNAPPRRVSGVGQSRVNATVRHDGEGVRFGSGIFYMGIHEKSSHRWFVKTIRSELPRFVAMMNGASDVV